MKTFGFFPVKVYLNFFWLVVPGILLASCVRNVPASSAEPFPSENQSGFPDISSQDDMGESTLEGSQEEEVFLEADSSGWSLERAGYQDEDLIILVLYSENPISQTYSGNLSGVSFECTTQEQKPNNLYCFGERSVVSDPWHFELIQSASGEVIFQTEISEAMMN